MAHAISGAKSFAAALAALLCAFGTHVHAQSTPFPSKAVKLIVPSPPGGTTDTRARILAQKLSTRWDQPVVLDNKPDGNTVIATLLAAQPPADGHTIVIAAMPFALNPLLMDKLPYDSDKDLMPVSLLTTVPGVFIANNEMGVNNVNDFIEKARADPSIPILFASAGSVTFTHLPGELCASIAKIKIHHIPYKGRRYRPQGFAVAA